MAADDRLPETGAISQPNSKAADRPRIGLVLGGGGARGAAHVGVLQVLEELRIPVDYIAGTSMGSIVAGLYASGMSVTEIDREMRSMDWEDLFQDAPRRAERSFRRKRDDDLYPVKAKVGFNKLKIETPLAYIRGQKFDLELNRLILPVADITDFDDLSIPYRAVAADLETGREVVLDHGSLARAIRASMAVPAAFDPVEIDGRMLVDGGIANNVPINVVRQMGAEIVIAVDVGAGLYTREKITSAISVTGQITNFLFTLNSDDQIKTLGPHDVLIRPDLGDASAGSFDRAGEIIPLGEKAAREMQTTLQAYSLTPTEYEKYKTARTISRDALPIIHFVHIENRSRLADEVIAARLSLQLGQPLDVEQLERDIREIYGLEIFESVRYEVVRENGQTGLLIRATEKSWGPGYLQFGLASSNNFKGDSTLRIGALYTLTEINELNGEWRTAIQLGDEPGIATEIHQPLDYASKYFVSGKLAYQATNLNVYDAAGNQTSSYRLEGGALELGAGREFGTWGEGRFGYRRENGTADLVNGNTVADSSWNVGEVFVRLSDDKLDNLYFPREGHYGTLEYRASNEDMGSDNSYDQVIFNYSHVLSWSDNTVIAGASLATTLNDNAPLERLFKLGGFLRLSGLEDQQLSGQQAGLMELIYMHRLYKIQFFESYLGASAEVGNVWQQSSDASFDSTIAAGSVFLGFDTPIGPLYIAYGFNDQDDRSYYIYLGPRVTF